MKSPSSEFLTSFKKVARGFKSFEFGSFDNQKIGAFHRIIPDAPRVLITAAIHGNEKAGPLGLYSYVARNKLPDDLSIILIPIINRYGFDNHERENEQGRDLNRAFNKPLKRDSTDSLEKIVLKLNPDLVLNLHEDGVHEGCYVYIGYEDQREDAEVIIKNASKYMTIEGSKTVFKDKCEQGIILSNIHDGRPKTQQTFETFLTNNNIPYFTFETSQLYSLKRRAAAQLAAIDSILG